MSRRYKERGTVVPVNRFTISSVDVRAQQRNNVFAGQRTKHNKTSPDDALARSGTTYNPMAKKNRILFTDDLHYSHKTR